MLPSSSTRRKCYHFYSKNVEHTFDSDIMQYVTHEQCRAANELGLSLSIHMVKKRALSDPSNLAVGETVILLTPPFLSLSKRLLTVEGGCSRMTVSPTVRSNLETIRMLCETYPNMIVCGRRRDGHSAAPPSPFSRCFNSDGEGNVSKMTVSPTANRVNSVRTFCTCCDSCGMLLLPSRLVLVFFSG